MLTTGCAFSVIFGLRESASLSFPSCFCASTATTTDSKRHVAPNPVNRRMWLIAKTPWGTGCARFYRPRRIVLIGGGSRDAGGPEQLRRLAAAGGLAARQKRVERMAMLVRGQGDAAELAKAVAEGLTLSEFDAGSYKTGEPAMPVPSWT